MDVPWGQVFRVDEQGRFALIADYDREPNGLKIHRDGRIFIADYARGIVQLDPDTGEVTPVLGASTWSASKAVNDLCSRPTAICISPTRA